ncbi:MAG: PASTA domain-containing protein [Coriobacteriales bacterium]|jgi:serine/threonine-protein kinase|nr:PASTA domain-containing protein [Coriobacteriales bacterium]
MSDFLSQFESGSVKPIPSASRAEEARPAIAVSVERHRQPAVFDVMTDTTSATTAFDAPSNSAEGGAAHAGFTQADLAETDGAQPFRTGGIQPVEHRVERDPSYRRRHLLRWALTIAAALAVILVLLLAWQCSRLVEIPELAGKPLATAQTFCREHGLELEVSSEYSMNVEKGIIINQGLAVGEKITKGSTFAITVSNGLDPDELLPLPNFASMGQSDAQRWIEENRAENLRLVLEYSESVAQGSFLRLEFRGSEVTAEGYRRRDYATLYYSKGAEVFEKNITVPDFSGKVRGEVENWAQTNGLKLSVSEEDSETVELGGVISQSIAAGEKLAKHDDFAVVVSLGRAIVVPNFTFYTAETALDAAAQVPVTVQTRFNLSVPYGRLISQSLPAGTRLLPGDERSVTVIYSEGWPYLKDYRGVSEEELPATFFNDYSLKGVELSYETVYVDSAEPKGIVVGMSDYSRFIPLRFHVVIEVSRGNLTPPPAPERADETNPTAPQSTATRVAGESGFLV